MTGNCDKPICKFSLLLLAAGWFLVALFVGETELLTVLPGLIVPVTVITLSIGVLAAYWQVRAFRSWVNSLDIRALVALHLTRFVGIYFLVLYAKGLLPGRFALVAGWGDIVVAIGATALLFFLGNRSQQAASKVLWPNSFLILWNAVGLLDILLVVATAGSIVIADRDSMGALLELPLSFLPTMIVPLIIASHVIMLVRLVRRNATVSPMEPGVIATAR